jgi:hypothetical protein
MLIKTSILYKEQTTPQRNKHMSKKSKAKTQDKSAAVLHGECGIIQSKIPADAKVVEVKNNVLIIADSESTGNHHVLDVVPGVEVLEKDNKRFVRNSVPADVRCIHQDRHDTLTIPAGEWELVIAQEFDYFEMSKRNVRD